MPRTASTFFQNEVFSHISGFDFFGVETTQYGEVFQRVLYQDESLYKHTDSIERLNLHGNKNYFFSNELFVGQSLYLSSGNRTRTALRLKELFPKGEIILFLRNQADLLESLYSIGVYAGQTTKPENFVQFDHEGSTVDAPLYPTFKAKEQTEQYFYSSLVELYYSCFEKVNVFLYEDFKNNPEEFLSNFCNQLDLELQLDIDFGKSTNSSLSSNQLKYLRMTNNVKGFFDSTSTGQRIFRKKVQTIEHLVGGGKSFQFAPALRQKIKNHFAEDNEKMLDILPGLKQSKTYQSYYLPGN